MAETLSYDNTPDTEVLTDEEQDSLEVGEELEAEHESLLAGKYKNAEGQTRKNNEKQFVFGGLNNNIYL